MKKIFFQLLLLCICFCSYSQNTIKAYIEIKKFYSNTDGTYIEIFNKINGESLSQAFLHDGTYNRVLIKYTINKKDSIISEIIDTIQSPLIKENIINDLHDIKTIPLSKGNYSLNVDYIDLNSTEKTKTSINQTTFEIKPFKSDIINLSNIQVCDYIQKTKDKNVLSKYGLDVLPHLGNYFSEEINFLPIYLEAYNIKKDTNKFHFSYSIFDIENQTEIVNKKDSLDIKIDVIHPIIKMIDIRAIPSGRYQLICRLLNINDNQFTSTNFEFYRSNNIEKTTNNQYVILDPNFQKSITSDSILFFAKSLIPIIHNEDQKTLLKLLQQKDTTKIRIFIQNFWQITSRGIKTYDIWINYKTQVLKTEKLYKTLNIHGFETERGRVFLKYGPPTSINARESSPSEYPYEIWQYDKIKTFANKRFVFYNPDIVGNNYKLLHSDMNGEIKNFKWPGFLRKRNNSTINVDDPLEGGFEHFGGESTEVYNQY